ncbi:MAG TPA: RluA family pseudouridine synthase [bacterium]|nr:RluA family pseudouridine synthase [bacterium]
MNKTRLDAYLASQHRHYSRTQIKKLIEDGFVLVNGEKRKPSFLLTGGETIEMVRRAPPIPKAEAEELPLAILHEDDDLLILNKAAGMVVHPAPGHFTGTLVSAVLHHLGRKGASNDLRPGIVHRLDKGTSGVMVVAKNELVQRKLAQQFKDREVDKTYQALVFGTYKQKAGTIDFAIGRDTIHRKKFSSRTKFGRNAVTHWEVVREFRVGTHGHAPLLSLLKIKIETGRTHQIRVHLSETHHPVVGDSAYGAKSYLSSVKDETAAAVLEGLTRPMLHAWRLSFAHPTTGKTLNFEAPLPEDMRSVIECLK